MAFLSGHWRARVWAWWWWWLFQMRFYRVDLRFSEIYASYRIFTIYEFMLVLYVRTGQILQAFDPFSVKKIDAAIVLEFFLLVLTKMKQLCDRASVISQNKRVRVVTNFSSDRARVSCRHSRRLSAINGHRAIRDRLENGQWARFYWVLTERSTNTTKNNCHAS